MLFCLLSIVLLSRSRETIICRSLGFLSFSLSLTFCSFVGQVAYELHLELQRLREAVLREAKEEEEKRKEKQEKVERWREEMEIGEEEEEEPKREEPLALKPREVYHFYFPWKCFTLLRFACCPTFS